MQLYKSCLTYNKLKALLFFFSVSFYLLSYFLLCPPRVFLLLHVSFISSSLPCLKGALRSFGEEFPIRGERSSLTLCLNKPNKQTLFFSMTE